MKRILLFMLAVGLLSSCTDKDDDTLPEEKTNELQKSEYKGAAPRDLEHGTYPVSIIKRLTPKSDADAIETVVGKVQRISLKEFQEKVVGSLWHKTVYYGEIKEGQIYVSLWVGGGDDSYLFKENNNLSSLGYRGGIIPYCDETSYTFNPEKNTLNIGHFKDSPYDIITAIDKDTIDVIYVNPDDSKKNRYFWQRYYREDDKKKADYLRKIGCQ